MILSVSRRTDIPNYYSEWFLNRIKEKYLYVRNPMNPRQVSRIDLSPDVVDCIVFWTKNPENMITQLDALHNYDYYFQFTLTGYGRDIEPNLPDKRNCLIPVFQRLSEKIGRERVIWRYDPILINERYSPEYHRKAFGEIARCLNGYTKKAVISFVDWYAKMQKNTAGYNIREAADEEIRGLAADLAGIAEENHLVIESCAEQIDLKTAGISHWSCIDKNLIEKITGCRISVKKDKNQRSECGCMESIDVGTYNTCLNGCRYCYANYSEKNIQESTKLFNANSPLLCGVIRPDDRVTERKVKSVKEAQMSLFNCR